MLPVALDIGVQLLGVMAPFIASGLGWLAVRLSQFVAAKTKSVTAGTAVLKLNEIITTVVAELKQTVVAAAKARAADGKLTPAEMEEIKRLAIERITAYLGAEGLALVTRTFGLTGADMSQFLGSKIEATVYALGHGVVPSVGAAGVAAPTELPPFFASSPSHPAQQGEGRLVPPNPTTTPGVHGR